MLKIIIFFLLLFSSFVTYAQEFSTDAQRTLREITSSWQFFNEVSCGKVTLTSYDKPGESYNSLLFKLHGKTIAFDISREEYLPVYMAAYIDNAWQVNTDPSVFTGDVMIMEAAQSNGLTVSDLGKCINLLLQLND